MQNLKLISFITILFLIACKSETKKETTVTDKTEKISQLKTSKKSVVKKPKNNGTYLCKINGKDWAYTKASGIIDKNPKTGKLTAIFTFKKKLEKGSESIQLYYDANSFELEGALLQLKVMKKGDKLGTAFYKINPSFRKKYTQTKLFGSIDLSNNTKASGTAKIENITMSKYEKKELKNQKDEEISITDLKFTDIGYSNLDKIFNNLKN